MRKMVANTQFRTAPHSYVGDGTHAGTRWWLEAVPGTLAPVRTLQIGIGGLRQFERPGTTVANVGAIIDVILADLAAGDARKASCSEPR
jgi:hypothetical protein